MKCRDGCTCGKHHLRNSGQFRRGGPGFKGRHSDGARAKIRAARAAQAHVGGGGPQPIDAFTRVMARVKEEGDCLIWQGATSHGYGAIGIGSSKDGTRKVARVHRVVFEHLIGPVPEGLELDHICRHRACVRIGHLEAVTHAVNLARARSAA